MTRLLLAVLILLVFLTVSAQQPERRLTIAQLKAQGKALEGQTVTVTDCKIVPTFGHFVTYAGIPGCDNDGPLPIIDLEPTNWSDVDRTFFLKHCQFLEKPRAEDPSCAGTVTGTVRFDDEGKLSLADAKVQWREPVKRIVGTERAFTVSTARGQDGREITIVACNLGYHEDQVVVCIEGVSFGRPYIVAVFPVPLSDYDRGRLVEQCRKDALSSKAECFASVSGIYDGSEPRAPALRQAKIHWYDGDVKVETPKAPAEARVLSAPQILIEAQERIGQRVTVKDCALKAGGNGREWDHFSCSTPVSDQKEAAVDETGARPKTETEWRLDVRLQSLSEEDQRWIVSHCLYEEWPQGRGAGADAQPVSAQCRADAEGTIAFEDDIPVMKDVGFSNWKAWQSLPPVNPDALTGADLAVYGSRFVGKRVTVRDCVLTDGTVKERAFCWLPATRNVLVSRETLTEKDTAYLKASCLGSVSFPWDPPKHCTVDVTGILRGNGDGDGYLLEAPSVKWH